MVTKPDLVFQQWTVSLQKRDRSRNAIYGNFIELFSALRGEELALEAAYEYLPKAIKSHLPCSSVVKSTYKKLKTTSSLQCSEKEFEETWNKSISEKATAAFFEVFPVPLKMEAPPEQAMFGSMTEKEYRAQRKHADEYPRLDTEELERRLHHPEDYNPVADIAAMMEKK